jgi:Transcriptional Coactivator p15 (PC4)
MTITNIKNLGCFAIDDKNKLVIDLDDINGTAKVSARVWYQGADGGWYPGRGGFTCPPAVWASMIKQCEPVPAEHLKPKTKATKAPATSGRVL